MVTTERQLRVVLEATEIVVSTLESMPPSTERDVLLQQARESLVAVEGWAMEPPTLEQRSVAMKTVLRLHTAAAKLGRLGPGK